MKSMLIVLAVCLAAALVVSSAPTDDATSTAPNVGAPSTTPMAPAPTTTSAAASTASASPVEDVSATSSTTTTAMPEATTGQADPKAAGPNATQPDPEGLGFACTGRQVGYYADVETKCKVYHFCILGHYNGQEVYQRISYMCLNETVFDQQALDCVESSKMTAPCTDSEKFYDESNAILRKAVIGKTNMEGSPNKEEEKKTEEPKGELKQVEESKNEYKKTEESKPEEKKADESKPEEMEAEGAKLEEKKADESKVEEKKVEESKGEDKKTEEPKREDQKREA